MLQELDTPPTPEPTPFPGIDPAYIGVRAVEARVHADYLAALGKEFRFNKVYGYLKNVQEAIKNDGSIVFRVVKTSSDRLIDWSTGELWLDPAWSLEVVEDPKGLTTGMEDLWYHATSYRIGTGMTDDMA
ncbi:hypothetical protein PUR29_34840 [Methylobacterium ajmalii]|uniref:Uncharacterized protein n=1 Tax=Methylobacterium ajmalii TaxID=2738439 RepID=A0ABV0A5P5_9HYPH